MTKKVNLNDDSKQAVRAIEREKAKGEKHLKRLLQEAQMIGTLKPGDELVYIPIPAGHRPEVVITSMEVNSKTGQRSIFTKALGRNNFGMLMSLLNAAMTTVTEKVWGMYAAAADELKGSVIEHAAMRQRHLDLDQKRMSGGLTDDEHKEFNSLVEQLKAIDGIDSEKPAEKILKSESILREIGIDKDGSSIMFTNNLDNETPEAIRLMLKKGTEDGVILQDAFIKEANEYLAQSQERGNRNADDVESLRIKKPADTDLTVLPEREPQESKDDKS